MAVSVRESGDEVLVEIRDDGVGFDPGAVTRGFGVAGMRERVDLAGGSLTVGSGPQGTCLTARLPAGEGAAPLRVPGADGEAGQLRGVRPAGLRPAGRLTRILNSDIVPPYFSRRHAGDAWR